MNTDYKFGGNDKILRLAAYAVLCYTPSVVESSKDRNNKPQQGCRSTPRCLFAALCGATTLAGAAGTAAGDEPTARPGCPPRRASSEQQIPRTDRRSMPSDQAGIAMRRSSDGIGVLGRSDGRGIRLREGSRRRARHAAGHKKLWRDEENHSG